MKDLIGVPPLHRPSQNGWAAQKAGIIFELTDYSCTSREPLFIVNLEVNAV